MNPEMRLIAPLPTPFLRLPNQIPVLWAIALVRQMTDLEMAATVPAP